jgi:hypothetical protein
MAERAGRRVMKMWRNVADANRAALASASQDGSDGYPQRLLLCSQPSRMWHWMPEPAVLRVLPVRRNYTSI